MTIPARWLTRKRSLATATTMAMLLPATIASTVAGAPTAMQKADAIPIPALGIDPFEQQDEISDKAGASGEEFGEAIAVSGHTLVVGTIHHMAASTDVEQGAAYVFVAPASGWAHAK